MTRRRQQNTRARILKTHAARRKSVINQKLKRTMNLGRFRKIFWRLVTHRNIHFTLSLHYCVSRYLKCADLHLGLKLIFNTEVGISVCYAMYQTMAKQAIKYAVHRLHLNGLTEGKLLVNFFGF